MRGFFLFPRFPGIILSAAVYGLAALPLPANAQTDTLEELEEDIHRQQKTSEEIERTAGESERLVTGDQDGIVTFADILADPDNVDLNFRFARQQVREGDLKGAATSLERILLLNPGFDDIRLFYAIVFFRLDNYEEAKQQFNLVLSHAPPPSLQAEAESYLSRIALRQKRTRFAASLSFGYHLDTNKNAAPSSKRVLVFGGPSNVRGPQKDTGILAIANASFTHDLGLQGGHEVFGGVTFLQDRQTVLNNIDIQSYTVSGGGIYHVSWFDVTPALSYTQLRIDKESYLRDYRLRLRLSKEFTPTFMGYIEPQFSHQKFQPIAESKASHGRDGNLWGINFGGAYVISPKQKIALDLQYENKNAVFKFHAYERTRATLTHTWLLGSGQFLISSGTAGIDLYNRKDSGVSPMKRRDETYRLRMIYGAPLNFFSELAADYTLPDQIGDIIFTLTGEQYWAVSNLNNYQYRNSKLQAMLTKKWNF